MKPAFQRRRRWPAARPSRAYAAPQWQASLSHSHLTFGSLEQPTPRSWAASVVAGAASASAAPRPVAQRHDAPQRCQGSRRGTQASEALSSRHRPACQSPPTSDADRRSPGPGRPQSGNGASLAALPVASRDLSRARWHTTYHSNFGRISEAHSDCGFPTPPSCQSFRCRSGR